MSKRKFSRAFVFSLGLLFILIFLTCGKNSATAKRESVFDKVVHAEKELKLTIPEISRLCDELKLEKKKVNVGDCELYVEEEGEGIPIVLLHGGPGATHHYFHPHFSQAKKFARVIYYDQRGCGLSDYKPGDGYTVAQAVHDLENLKKALGIEKWVVLGHSYGGYLAQRYTMEFPESVAGLVLVTAAPGLAGKVTGTRQYDYISDEEKQKIREVGQQLGKLLEEKKLPEEKFLEILVYNRHLNGDWKRQSYYKPLPEEFARMALYEWKHDSNFNHRMSEDMNRVNLDGAFQDCPIPTLILESKWDLTWTVEKPDEVQKNHPGSLMVLFEQSGHNPFADEPRKFFQVLKKFIKELPPVHRSALTKWKIYLEKWRKDQEDPFLSTPISGLESGAIKEFRIIRENFNKGRRFLDMSTPLKSFLSYLSALHFRDSKAFELVHGPRSFPWSETDSGKWDKWMEELDVFRAPIPPEHPEPGDIWPVYLKKKSAEELYDTHLFVFWEGKWFRFGNMGGKSDWRPWAPRFKGDFLELRKKK